ncbi:FecR protein [Pseudobythopirellula maris]|uniref:FecR protein n=1 Tax=Pseudobythopirellula maris TaxID=2527991 RepID=A0A5C5ZTB7_9BACT|nr:FecR domain-containing protein [Pseudobythopirellula maris]TWT90490.1 FecR protein [Pseudobythopirellula maris]
MNQETHPQADAPAEDDLEEVLLRSIDGSVTAEQKEWLDSVLRHNPEIRARASRFLVDESLLAEETRSERRALELTHLLTPPPAAEPARPARGGLLRFIDTHGLLMTAIAAVLMAALLTQNLVTLSKIKRLHSLAIVDPEQDDPAGAVADESDERSWSATEDSQLVARVTGVRDAVWESDESELAFGDAISKGDTVQLASGVLELLLTTGAKVTVEGPASFEASSSIETTLSRGKIAAAVPRSARGYTILTPTSEVVDIGTQFGVSVEDSGDSEVHVFDGDVVARSRQADASTELIHAKRDEAMRFDSESDVPVRFAARNNDFVRSFDRVLSSAELPPLPVHRKLELWLASDTLTEAKEGDAVATWRDLQVGDNDFSDDAWQFDERRCPRLVIDERGRRALRFDGWSTYMATTPMETGARQTVVVAYSPGPTSFANDYHGGILLKYPGAPSMELALFADRSVRGWVWPGQGSASNVGVIRSAPVEHAGVAVAAYAYDSTDDHAELWANGESQGTASAPIALISTGRRYLGSHPHPHIEAGFFGNLYEVLVYNTRLEPAEMDELNHYFQQRYAETAAP